MLYFTPCEVFIDHDVSLCCCERRITSKISSFLCWMLYEVRVGDRGLGLITVCNIIITYVRVV